MNYGISRRRFDSTGQVEHYDRGFRMDTAFYNRTGFTSGWVFGALSFYPDRKTRSRGSIRIVPFTFTQGGHDRVQDGHERISVNGVRLHMTRNGFFRVDRSCGREPWQGDRVRHGRAARVRQRAARALAARRSRNFNAGGAIYYDATAPFQGDSRSTTRRADVPAELAPDRRRLGAARSISIVATPAPRSTR